MLSAKIGDNMQNTIIICQRIIGPTALLCALIGLGVLIVEFRQGIDITFLSIGLVLGLLSWKSKLGKTAVFIPAIVVLALMIMAVH